MATAANPFDIKAGGTLTNATGATAAQFTPQERQVNAEQETTSGQLKSIMAEDSPLMQQARAQAKQGMAQRGLINSSMSQGAGVAAMLERATPIAQSNATTFANQALTNQQAVNTGGQFNAGEQNKFGLQTGAQAFTAGQNLVTQNFTAAQAQLDRAQQTALADKSVEAQQALQAAQNNFNSAQNALNRSQETALQSSAQTFTAGQSALERGQQTSLQTAQQTFTAAQSALERAQQVALTDKSIQAQTNLQKAQQDFTGAQAGLDRAQQTALQAGQQTFTAAQSALERGQQTSLQNAQQTFAGAQAALDRAQQLAISDKSIQAQANLQKAQQDFAGAQAGLDRAQQTALQAGQQEFTAGQNKSQQDFLSRQSELEQSGLDFRQARDIASREALTKLEQAGIDNRFDQELALKSSQFSVEQTNLEKRQIADNAAQLDRLGLQIKAQNQNIPTTFAANISNTTMSGVNAIMADGQMDATAKKNAIANLVTYANSQIAWAEKFYGATIPKITTPI